MKHEIIPLSLADYQKCGNIWNMQEKPDLAAQFYRELQSGNRTTYVYTINGEFIGEISTVKDSGDSDYTIPDRRLYLSRLIVKSEYRRQGIGRLLTDHVAKKAKALGYRELSVGVDLDNYAALKLYIEAGFDKILFIGEDEYGRYVKLLKSL